MTIAFRLRRQQHCCRRSASVADYRKLQERLGTTRNVVVQPSTYGTDNRLLIESLAQFGPTARGIVMLDRWVGSDELKRLNDKGVRGVRFTLLRAAGMSRPVQ